MGVTQALAKGGVRSAPSRILSSVAYWGILLVFFMMGFVALDVIPINNLISDLLSYLPSIIAAALIVFFGFIIGDFVERAVLVAAGNAGISQADLIGKGVKLFIVVMTISMALGPARDSERDNNCSLFYIIRGIVFAVALAFGLGAKDIAREFLEKRLKKEIKEPTT